MSAILIIACEKEEENKSDQTPPFTRWIGIDGTVNWYFLNKPRISDEILDYTVFKAKADSLTPFNHNVYHTYSGFPESYLCDYITIAYVPKSIDTWRAEVVHFYFQNQGNDYYIKVKDCIKKYYNTDSAKFYRNGYYITLQYEYAKKLAVYYCTDNRDFNINNLWPYLK